MGADFVVATLAIVFGAISWPGAGARAEADGAWRSSA